ncbi:MAG: response regulator [Polyangiales bacterium]
MSDDELRKETVLIVDDEPMVRDIVARVLETVFARVLVASGGDAAIAHLNERRVDLLVTDLKMPGVSGLDVARAALARGVRTRVIAISGYVTPADEDALAALGVDLLRKPFDVDALLTRVERLLDAP